MNIGSDDLLYVRWLGATTWDPAAATVTLEVDGAAYTMAWEAPATSATEWDPSTRANVTRWRRTARTDAKFAGVDRPETAGPTVIRLSQGRHEAKVILSLADGQRVGSIPMALNILPSTT